jgi:F-type H+-transporting ATPase subunit b
VLFKRFVSLLIVSAVIVCPALPRTAAAQDNHATAHEHIGTANAGPGLEKPEEYKSDLAIATFIVFLVLLAILWKFAWGPIVAALDRREQMVADHIAQAERNHAEARQLLLSYEQKLASAANEIREMMEGARRDAERAKQSILAEAKAGAEAERARALRDIESATDQAIESLAERSANLAVELAGKILKSQLSSADHARLIEEAMGKFSATSASAN